VEKHLSFAFMLTLSSLAFLIGCNGTIKIPLSDLTAPSVTSTVSSNEQGHIATLTSGDAPLQLAVTRTDEIVLLATATDNDGVIKNVAIQGETTITCTSGQIGQDQTALIISQNPVPGNPMPGDEVAKIRATSFSRVIQEMRSSCGQGFSFSRLRGTLFGTAENFHRRNDSTASFTFTHQ
jgi:hypothetical protein